MASQLTVTKSKTGPGSAVAALLLTGLKQFNLDMDRKVLFTNSDIGLREFDINATTTLTCTITAGANCTMVVNEP
jgi:septum formation inhibitor-activating ATPase MinD